jgi:hypothetical protein
MSAVVSEARLASPKKASASLQECRSKAIDYDPLIRIP